MPGKAASGRRSLPSYIQDRYPDVKIILGTFRIFSLPAPPFPAARLPGPAAAVILARPSRPSAIMDDARLNNDAPITDPGQDRLGFGELARHLADAFLRNDLSRGLLRPATQTTHLHEGSKMALGRAAELRSKGDQSPCILPTPQLVPFRPLTTLTPISHLPTIFLASRTRSSACTIRTAQRTNAMLYSRPSSPFGNERTIKLQDTLG